MVPSNIQLAVVVCPTITSQCNGPLDFSEIRFTTYAVIGVMVGRDKLALLHCKTRPDKTLKLILVVNRVYNVSRAGYLIDRA